MATLAGVLQLCAIMHDGSNIATSAVHSKHQRVGGIGVYDIGIIVRRYAKVCIDDSNCKREKRQQRRSGQHLGV